MQKDVIANNKVPVYKIRWFYLNEQRSEDRVYPIPLHEKSTPS